jgi:hypothetical protein
LSASADLLLAISTGNLGVQTLDLKANPALRQFVPDQTAPPLNNERPLTTSRTNTYAPNSTVVALGENPAATAEVLKAEVLKNSFISSETTRPVSAQQIYWGRWADVANLGKGVDLGNFVKGLEPIGISWPSYFVARNNDSLVMPGAGVANFSLNTFEAGVYLGNNPSSAIAAQITNPTPKV